ncbi:hypothetical protein AURDEDRAFT_170442 [Auricularia subglabra TFB-10046 SS5]|nr:hypothetical protein AURDEDRAFT_170442 [Auricularia subglabra TFB-10046 SS5]
MGVSIGLASTRAIDRSAAAAKARHPGERGPRSVITASYLMIGHPSAIPMPPTVIMRTASPWRAHTRIFRPAEAHIGPSSHRPATAVARAEGLGRAQTRSVVRRNADSTCSLAQAPAADSTGRLTPPRCPPWTTWGAMRAPRRGSGGTSFAGAAALGHAAAPGASATRK